MTLKSFSARLRVVARLLRALLGKAQRHDETIRICGDPAFRSATVGALQLLQQKAPEAYAMLKKHVGHIISCHPSSVLTDGSETGASVIMMGPAYSSAPVADYAAALAHEACHCEFRKPNGEGECDSGSSDAERNEHEEALCLRYQCEVLENLGVDEDTVARYRAQLATRWWETPFEKQDW